MGGTRPSRQVVDRGGPRGGGLDLKVLARNQRASRQAPASRRIAHGHPCPALPCRCWGVPGPPCWPGPVGRGGGWGRRTRSPGAAGTGSGAAEGAAEPQQTTSKDAPCGSRPFISRHSPTSTTPPTPVSPAPPRPTPPHPASARYIAHRTPHTARTRQTLEWKTKFYTRPAVMAACNDVTAQLCHGARRNGDLYNNLHDHTYVCPSQRKRKNSEAGLNPFPEKNGEEKN